MVNPIVEVANVPVNSQILIIGYVSQNEPKKYWHSDNGVAAISDVVYDNQHPLDYLSYITEKYDLPEGYTIYVAGISDATSIELSGTL